MRTTARQDHYDKALEDMTIGELNRRHELIESRVAELAWNEPGREIYSAELEEIEWMLGGLLHG